MKRFSLFLWFVAVTVVVGWALRANRSGPHELQPVGADVAGDTAADSNPADGIDFTLRTTERPRLVSSASRRLPKSLRGTDVDGGLSVDAEGRFVPDRDAVAMFEYYLTGLGEESYEDVIARITNEIYARLPQQAAKEAVAFLQRYLDYREKAGRFAESEEAGDLRAGLDRLKALRREAFGEALALELFGDEERRVEFALAQREIAADPILDEESKRQRLADAYAEVPTEQIEARRRATQHLELAEAEAVLKGNGASPEEIRAERESRFGAEAADRLAALDHRREEWRGRVEEYRGERAKIESDRSLTPDEKRALVEEIERERFDRTEMLRVRALDRLSAAD